MVRPTQFKIEQTAADRTRTLSISGELDIATTPQLEREVNRAIAEKANTILIDLENLSFIDSSGLRMFLHLNQQAAQDGWRLTIANPSEQVRAILRVTGTESELPIMQTGSAS